MSKVETGLKKGLTITLLFGIALGIGTVNLCMTEAVREASPFPDLFAGAAAASQKGADEIFFRIFSGRMVLLALFVLAGCAKPFLPVAAALSLFFGWLLGIYQGGAVLQQGIAGLGMALAVVTPQMFFYGGAVYLLLKNGWLREKGRIVKNGEFFSGMLVAGGVYFLGILTESCVNPALIRFLLKIF
ncbi:MAG: hypothetical protein Q4F41_11550 [Eubacteriales bacterium]|nr:hypothetical protein [Eubacteriales bacterium]